MSQTGYLILAISILVLLGVAALSMYLYLRKGPKVEHKACEGCGELDCPIARRRNEQ